VPIVINPDPLQVVNLSPGQVVGWTSDFVGPLPVGTSIHVNVARDSEGLQSVATAIIDTQIPTGEFRLMDKSTQAWHPGEYAIPTGQTAHVLLELHEPGTTVPIDSGAATYTWTPESNVAMTAPIVAQGGGGLTSEQSLQLSELHAYQVQNQVLDLLTLLELTNGPSAGPINAQLPSPIFGIIVRLAALPPEIVLDTPDADYSVKTLAVVRVFRGSDLWMRVPIHTTNKIIPLEGEGIVSAIATAFLQPWLLNMSIQVTFLEGVLGQVFVMRLP